MNILSKIIFFISYINFHSLYAVNDDSLKQNYDKYYQQISVVNISNEYIGTPIRDFKTIKKGSITTDLLGIGNLIMINAGIGKNVDISLGTTIFSDYNAAFNDSFIGIRFGKQISKHIIIGIDGNVGYDFHQKYIISNINYGGQFQNKKISIGSSFHIKLGKNKVYDDLMINSFNIFGLYRIWRKGNIGTVFIYSFNPKFYLSESYYPLYSPSQTNLYYEFLMKRSKLALGVYYAYNRAYYYSNRADILPFLKFSYLIKK